MRLAALSMIACAGLAAAQERPSQYTHAAALALPGAESHYRFALPAEAYRGTVRRDLADLRVFNAAGEPVPYAFVPLRPEPRAPEARPARLFPLHGEAAKGLDGVDLRIEQTARGTVIKLSSKPGAAPARGRELLGYLLDAGEETAPLAALELDWRGRSGFTGSARVEASEDLKHWRTLVVAAPLLYLEYAGERLERRRIELAGTRARYLRLSFTGMPKDFALAAVRLELRPEKAEPAREWLALDAAAAARPHEYEFDTGGHFPIERLRFSLPEPNTVAPVQVLARARPEDPWRFVAAATLYRLRREGGEVVNPEVVVPAHAGRYWLVKVEPRSGGLGTGALGIEIGWIPHEIVFAARGEAPFTLAWGMKLAKPGALPIATVLPGYREDEAAALKRAALARPAPATHVPPPSALEAPLEYLRAAADSGEAKKWLLWASLLAAVALLGWMAFALLRQLGKR